MIIGDMKLVKLMNPENFNISMAGIGFKYNEDNCLLVVFKEKRVIFNRSYKSIKSAKRGFANFFKNDEDIKPLWPDFSYSYTYKRKKKKDRKNKPKTSGVLSGL